MARRNFIVVNGVKTESCMKIRRTALHKLTGYSKVKNTTWAAEDKPWRKYKTKGLHSSSEMHYLYKKAKSLGPGNYAQLGVYRGASVNALASGLLEFTNPSTIYAVDVYREDTPIGYTGAFSEREYREYLNKYDLSNIVKPCPGLTEDWAKKLSDKKFKFIFIDADHTYEHCKVDFRLWGPLLEEGGEIAFHDVDMNTVDRVIQEEVENPFWEETGGIYRIRSFRKTKLCPW